MCIAIAVPSYYAQASLLQTAELKVNIARIANAVQCHNQLSDNKDCHDFRFSIVRIVISVSNVTSLRIVFVSVVNNYHNCHKCHKNPTEILEKS